MTEKNDSIIKGIDSQADEDATYVRLALVLNTRLQDADKIKRILKEFGHCTILYQRMSAGYLRIVEEK